MTKEYTMYPIDSFMFKVVRLNVHHFFTWSNYMKIILRRNRLRDFVSPDERTTSDQLHLSAASESRCNGLALEYIMMSVEPPCKSSMLTMSDWRKVWEKLTDLDQSVSEAAINAGLTRLLQMQMIRNESVIKYSNRIDGLMNDLKSAEHYVTGSKIRMNFLTGPSKGCSVVA